MRKTIIALVLMLCLLSVLVWSLVDITVPNQYHIYNSTSTNLTFTLQEGVPNATLNLFTKTNRSANYTINITDYFIKNTSGGTNITNLTWRDGDRVYWISQFNTSTTTTNNTARLFDIIADYATGINLFTSLTIGGYKVNLSSTGDVNGTSAYFSNYYGSSLNITGGVQIEDSLNISNELLVGNNVSIGGNLTITGINASGSAVQYICIDTSFKLIASSNSCGT